MHADWQVPFEKGKTLSCAVNSPAGKDSAIGIILAHGAGGDMHSGNLPQFAEAFAGAGFVCVRFTCKPTQLAYRIRACQAVIDGAASSRRVPLERVTQWIFAGHSMVLSALAKQSDDKLRDSPLVDLALPILFVHGSKDTMCEADTFQAVRGRMSCSELQVHEVADGDHGLKVHAGKDSKSQTETALQDVACAICKFAQGVEKARVSEAQGKSEISSIQLQDTTSHDKNSVARKRVAPATSHTRNKKAKP